MGSELLQRQEVVRQTWEKRECVAEGEVGGSKNCSLVQRGVPWRKRPKTQVSLLKWTHGIPRDTCITGSEYPEEL